MYVSPDQLKETYRTLTTATIQDKLLSGALTNEAREIAVAELASRGVDRWDESNAIIQAPSAETKAQTAPRASLIPGPTAMKIIFNLYLFFVVLCVLVMLADPPWNSAGRGGYDGMFGVMASFGIGFPWSVGILVFLSKIPFIGYGLGLMLNNHTVYWMFLVLCAAVNPVLFMMYFRRRSD